MALIFTGVSPMIPILGLRTELCVDDEHDRQGGWAIVRGIRDKNGPIAEELVCLFCGCRWIQNKLDV